ncbi:hypothetical protein MFUR16E_04825 [Methylobacterium fujisawaense]|uniref:hypothetical protein n=1 Tax=Methylobacterium fujisawaense TaxID=107400 RepID=UPI002F33BBFF
MTRLLSHAGALLCALAVSVVCLVLTKPTAIEFVAEVLALGFLGYGLCLARTSRGGLVAAALAAGGLLMVVFATPAAAATAHKAVPMLSTIEAPAQPLALAAPVAPQQVVVSVAPAEANTVAVPLGQWLQNARDFLEALFLAVLAFVLRKLPAPIVWVVKMYGEDKIVQQAIAMAINAVPGAAKGEALSVPVGSSVLAHALQWVVDNVPRFAVSMMGGEDAIKAKIFAALHLEADASAAAMGVAATA